VVHPLRWNNPEVHWCPQVIIVRKILVARFVDAALPEGCPKFYDS
jgi:hypothetical protein